MAVRIPGLWRTRMALRSVNMRLQMARAERAVAHFPQQRRKRAHGLGAPLVVTLTSYPPRFSHLGKTLRSLLDQTVAADHTILWIAHADMDQLPDDVLDLRDHGLEIRACEDLRSYKKLIPAWREDPARYFVTADDDVYYPPRWLAGLVEAARRYPGNVIAWRARGILFNQDGDLAPYRDWPVYQGRSRAGGLAPRIMPTGIGGILYPPDGLDNQVDDSDLFTKFAPHGDDIWFYWMSRAAGMGHRMADKRIDIVEWPTSQADGLYVNNLLGDGNDRQLAAMIRHFGLAR